MRRKKGPLSQDPRLPGRSGGYKGELAGPTLSSSQDRDSCIPTVGLWVTRLVGEGADRNSRELLVLEPSDDRATPLLGPGAGIRA